MRGGGMWAGAARGPPSAMASQPGAGGDRGPLSLRTRQSSL